MSPLEVGARGGSLDLDSEFPVHPVAAAFPMLNDDEILSLASDIGKHGLHQPIVLSKGVVIDGRNRLKACGVASVKPTFVELDAGVDPVAFILSANMCRRHMSKGAQAVSIALAEVAAGGFGRGSRAELSSGFGISTRYFRMARTVVENDIVIEGRRCFADSILGGGVSLREAYDEVTRAPTSGDQIYDYGHVKRRLVMVWAKSCWAMGLDPGDLSHPIAEMLIAQGIELLALIDEHVPDPSAGVQIADAIDSLDETAEMFFDLARRHEDERMVS